MGNFCQQVLKQLGSYTQGFTVSYHGDKSCSVAVALPRKYISTITIQFQFEVSLRIMITRNESFNRNSTFSYKAPVEMLHCDAPNFDGNFSTVLCK